MKSQMCTHSSCFGHNLRLAECSAVMAIFSSEMSKHTGSGYSYAHIWDVVQFITKDQPRQTSSI